MIDDSRRFRTYIRELAFGDFRGSSMKAVILAGGTGTRLKEITEIKPKPLVDIGGHPILWHIMKLYSHHGVIDFVVCLGYKGYLIKEYFANYSLHNSDVTFDMRKGKCEVHQNHSEPWRVTLVDTGEETMTGGRIKRIADHLAGEDTFCATYGDGVSDVDIGALISFHREHGRLATLTAVRPPARFGALELAGPDLVRSFQEKPVGDNAYINGGFFVLSKGVLDYIAGDGTVWEREPLERLAREDQLKAFRHDGFWHPMDTLRDQQYLDGLWSGGTAEWKVWR
jgi:glucose-1-phosphate cytidylyltransferase